MSHIHRFLLPATGSYDAKNSKRDQAGTLFLKGICGCKEIKWHLGVFDDLVSLREHRKGRQALSGGSLLPVDTTTVFPI